LSAPSLASTASSHQNELLLFFTLLELSIIVLAGRADGAIASRFGQSPAAIFSTLVTTPALHHYLPRKRLNEMDADTLKV
jgi:hypothetical protein